MKLKQDLIRTELGLAGANISPTTSRTGYGGDCGLCSLIAKEGLEFYLEMVL